MTSRGFYYLAGSSRGQYEANVVFWLITRVGLSFPLGEKCVERTNKVRNFWTMSAMKKSGRRQSKKGNIEDTRGFIVVQTQMAFFPGSRNTKRKLSFLILMNAKSVLHMISPLLIKVVQLIWPRCFLAFL